MREPIPTICTRYRPHPLPLLALTAIGTGPLLYTVLAGQASATMFGSWAALLLVPAAWTIGYVLWLGSHVFELTPEALVRKRMNIRRQIDWNRSRSLRRRSTVLLGTHGALVTAGFLQCTRWEVLDRRGRVLTQVPSIMRGARRLRHEIEACINGQPPKDTSRDRRWALPPREAGIAIPLELALVLLPTAGLTLLAAMVG